MAMPLPHCRITESAAQLLGAVDPELLRRAPHDLLQAKAFDQPTQAIAGALIALKIVPRLDAVIGHPISFRASPSVGRTMFLLSLVRQGDGLAGRCHIGIRDRRSQFGRQAVEELTAEPVRDFAGEFKHAAKLIVGEGKQVHLFSPWRS
jgi:hypothetical protein